MTTTTAELQSLKRIEELLTVLVRVATSEQLRSIRADKHLGFLFEHTGRLPVKELSRKTGFAAGKISQIWHRWEDAGLLIKDGKQYRRLI